MKQKQASSLSFSGEVVSESNHVLFECASRAIYRALAGFPTEVAIKICTERGMAVKTRILDASHKYILAEHYDYHETQNPHGDDFVILYACDGVIVKIDDNKLSWRKLRGS